MFNDTVSVEGTDMILDEHFGSAYTMNDYTTESHNLFASITVLPIPSLQLTGMVNYTMATTGMEDVDFPDRSVYLEPDELPHHDLHFDETPGYSNLDYQILRLGLAAEYRLTPMVTLTGEIDYADLNDDGIYVYGDESGSLLLTRAGLRFRF